jgi:D-alanine-D-alanine ligase
VVKPVSGGASIGVFLDNDGTGVQPLNDTLFAEKFIVGTLVTCAIFPVLDSDLPLLEIRHNGPILTNEAKRLSNACVEICPASISEPAEGRIRQASRLLYEALHATGPIRFDYIVDSCGGEWLLEANSLPGFSRRSNLARITAKAGFSYEELIAAMAVQALDASAMMHKK